MEEISVASDKNQTFLEKHGNKIDTGLNLLSMAFGAHAIVNFLGGHIPPDVSLIISGAASGGAQLARQHLREMTRK